MKKTGGKWKKLEEDIENKNNRMIKSRFCVSDQWQMNEQSKFTARHRVYNSILFFFLRV